ncbi:MAG: PAS domain-containing protein, partial [Candidatus Brocadiae bacterium]|nr:PAS domain-containing protein [Candidatus Brocadiia bacterium]
MPETLQQSELLLFLLGGCVLLFMASQRARLRRLPAWPVLATAYCVLLGGWVLTILEGFFWGPVLNVLEHVCYAAMTFVGIVDLCSLLATLAALVFLGAGRRRALRRDARCVLVFLLLFAAFHHFSHVLAWLAGASRLDPVRDYAGVLWPVLWGLFLYVFMQDVGQKELRESEERNRMLLASLPQRIFFKMGPELRFASVNDVFARDLDLSPPEVIGKTDFDFSPRELAEKYQADDRRVMASRKPETLVEKNVTRGVERIVEVTKAPVVNDDGDVVGLFGVFTDVTERKRT